MEKEIFERLFNEFTELNVKVTKLREFLTDEDKMKDINQLNRDLLITQFKAMETYASILSIRIGLNATQEMLDETSKDQPNE